MRKISVLAALFLVFGNVYATGIAGMVGRYIDITQQRMALEAFVGETGVEAALPEELLDAENELLGELEAVARDRDMGPVLAGYILEKFEGENLLLLSRFIYESGVDPPDLSAEIDRVRSLGVSSLRTIAATDSQYTGRGVVLAPGGALFSAPVFDAPVISYLAEGAELNIRAVNGNFYRVSSAAEEGYIHYSAVVIDDEVDKSTAKETDALEEFQSSLPNYPDMGDLSGLEAHFSRSEVIRSTSGVSDIEPDTARYTRIRNQRPTYYKTAMEAGFPVSGTLYGRRYTGTETRDIRRPDGSVIARTSGRFFAALSMQGSGVLKNGVGVTYISNFRFREMPQGCLGVTSTGNWVMPFRTLAVNPRMMPYREVYYIPGTRGIRLPNGEVHDGFWFAHDTGGAFQNTVDRIDLYVKRADWVRWMEHNFVGSFTPIRVYRVDPATRRHVTEKYRHLMSGSAGSGVSSPSASSSPPVPSADTPSSPSTDSASSPALVIPSPQSPSTHHSPPEPVSSGGIHINLN